MPGSDAPCILCFRASVPGHPSPLVFHLHSHPGWQKPGWACTSAAGHFSLASHDVGLLFWKGHFSSNPIRARQQESGCWYRSHLSHLSPAQHILPAQNKPHPKTGQVLCSASLGFRKVVRWFLGPAPEKNLYVKSQHYISMFKF